ncbi:MAG: Ppx/GppA phosphatase family protein [Solirubrobacteraceae bacterium]|nr:MAG: Ppx/GppA family phosphatase [Solirubrobacterales bacterium]
MRVAVVDVGTNSTRLLVAEIDADGRVEELYRESQVTRLGAGVDATGTLADQSISRVFATLDEYRRRIDELAPSDAIAVLTSAVRDASNGAAFLEQVRDRYGLDARTIDGDEEAQLTFIGATSQRPRDDQTNLLVVDIGGGSTELVLGRGHEMRFHVSTQSGVVRQTERHLHSDPPQHDELVDLADEVRAIITAAVPKAELAAAEAGIAVAGTATACAAIALELEPYDPDRVEGYVLDQATFELLLARLADMTVAARRDVVGLHPDRAPTIVAGVVILLEVIQAFGLNRITVSEHDILRGGGLRRAGVV